MKHYRALNELGLQIWEGPALSAEFALIRAWRSLGYETTAQYKAAHFPLKIEEVKNDEGQ